MHEIKFGEQFVAAKDPAVPRAADIASSEQPGRARLDELAHCPFDVTVCTSFDDVQTQASQSTGQLNCEIRGSSWLRMHMSLHHPSRLRPMTMLFHPHRPFLVSARAERYGHGAL